MSRDVDRRLATLYMQLWDALTLGDTSAVEEVLVRADELKALHPRAMRWDEERYEMDVLGALARGDDRSVVARTAHLQRVRSDDPVGLARAIALVNLGRNREAMEFARVSTAGWTSRLLRQLKQAPEGDAEPSPEWDILQRFLRVRT